MKIINSKNCKCQYCSESKVHVGSIIGKTIKTYELKPTYLW